MAYQQLIKEQLVFDPRNDTCWEKVYDLIFTNLEREYEDRMLQEQERACCYYPLRTLE